MRLRSLVPAAACLVSLCLGGGALQAQTAVPGHVKTWLYYGATHLNESVPAQFIAARADFAEADASQPDFVNRFKGAGGRYAVMYTDPLYIPYCEPPFAPPAGPCKGPIGNGPLPESAWLHGPDHERVHRADQYTHQYQEVLNPASPAARSAFRGFTAAAASRSRVDVFFADDSGSPLKGPDGSPSSGAFYRFNAAAVELPDDAGFIDALRGLLASAARPVVVNGADPVTFQPAYDGALIDAPNVLGELVEGCFIASWYRDPLSGQKWRLMADGQLGVTRHKRYAVCMMQGDGLSDPLKRLYGLASWWLTYDPQWSVIAPVSPGSDGAAVFSEEAIVPTEPLRSAQRSVEDLRAGALYVREFRRCYEDGRPIGACAAVVNASASTAALPNLAQSYGASLSLSSKSAYAGGTNVWSHGVSRTLGPLQAAILRS